MIKVYGAEGVRQNEIGLFSIEPEFDADMVVVQTRSAGLLIGRSGMTAGYSSKSQIFMTDISRCSVVVFDYPKDEAMRAALGGAIGGENGVCVVQKQGGTDEEIDKGG